MIHRILIVALLSLLFQSCTEKQKNNSTSSNISQDSVLKSQNIGIIESNNPNTPIQNIDDYLQGSEAISSNESEEAPSEENSNTYLNSNYQSSDIYNSGLEINHGQRADNSSKDLIEDGTHSANVEYTNPETGYSASYQLDVEVDDNFVTTIHFPSGGYLDSDHITPGELEDGHTTVEGEDGKTYEIEITD
jgi:hypothetical protein